MVTEVATTATPVTASAPQNLPTGAMPQIGYTAATAVVENAEETAGEVDVTVEESSEAVLSPEMQELENRAHANRVLLSSDAMRNFIKQCPNGLDRITFLDRVLSEARVTYPTEDGWVVLNAERMTELCRKRHSDASEVSEVMVDAAKKAAVAAVVPVGSGSMAEAIVTSNVAAAYQLAEARPMIALADAAADLDALYRRKKGEKTVVSDLLEGELTSLTLEQLETAITALTGALDGTYTDEASAVKMAVLKAVKALS